jgi:hypothetical protein
MNPVPELVPLLKQLRPSGDWTPSLEIFPISPVVGSPKSDSAANRLYKSPFRVPESRSVGRSRCTAPAPPSSTTT